MPHNVNSSKEILCASQMDAIELSVDYNKFKDINKELNSNNRSMCQSKTALIVGANRSFILSQI